MRYITTPLPSQSTPESQVTNISAFKGLNVATTSTQIGDTESPDMLNITVDPYGSVEKRRGYFRIFQDSLGPGKVNGLFEYHKIDGTEYICFAHGGKFYKLVNDIAIEIATPAGLGIERVRAFTMNDLFFIQDGLHYYMFDGTTVKNVIGNAYTPTISISRAPNGTQTTFNEGFNLLNPAFIDSFSGTTTDTIYILSQDELDETPVEIDSNGVVYIEGTHFTVNRSAGSINFAGGSSPLGIPGLGTNNVQIKAFKTHADLATFVTNCRFHIIFGGTNDTKVFIAGDREDINILRYSATYDPTYFADNDYIQVGSNSEAITGFSLQYDTLVIHKKDSKWHLSYQVDNNGIPYFPIRPVNDSIGCIAEDSIALINNDPITLAKTGVFILKGSNVRDERNVESVSVNINPLLLKEITLENAVAVDYDNKYILVIDNIAYIFDYYQGIWFKWNNIKASCFMIYGKDLYFGSNESGLIYKFATKQNKPNHYNDDGEAINCYWKSKIFSLGTVSRTKLIDKIFYSMLPGTPSSVDAYYKSDMITLNELGTTRRKLMSYSAINYNDWSYKATIYPDIIPVKLRAKKITYFQLIFENNRLDESMTILNIDIKYKVEGFKK